MTSKKLLNLAHYTNSRNVKMMLNFVKRDVEKCNESPRATRGNGHSDGSGYYHVYPVLSIFYLLLPYNIMNCNASTVYMLFLH